MHPSAGQQAFAALKEIPFYVCPGTSSWNTVVGRTDNAIANLINAGTYRSLSSSPHVRALLI
jgi:hypothetical protein